MADFIGKLKDFQTEGFDFCLENPYNLLNFEAGLGKTITSLAVACKTGGKTLVVCPAFLKNNWKREIDKFTKDLDYDITSYASVKKIANNFDSYKVIILDEVHMIKNRDALRSQLLLSLIEEHKPSIVMGLTGTPVSSRVSEFHNLLQMCYFGGKYPEFKPFHRLYYKFCNYFSYERTFEVNGFPIVRFDGVRRRKELVELIKPVLIRRKADLVLDLPGEVETNIVGTGKKYDKQLKEALELFNADPNDPAYMSIKSANALAKVDTTVKQAKELIEQGARPLIFTCHIETARQIAKKLKCQYIDGSVNADKRQNIIDVFNEGNQSALVCTIASTSTGFNITSTNYTIFNDLPFTPADIEQAKKRTLRIGQNKTCFYYYIFTSAFDESLGDMIKRKKRDIDKIFNEEK
jgi:SNF2 family DNA or RNA helicase